jgi:hypothetical protein
LQEVDVNSAANMREVPRKEGKCQPKKEGGEVPRKEGSKEGRKEGKEKITSKKTG